MTDRNPLYNNGGTITELSPTSSDVLQAPEGGLALAGAATGFDLLLKNTGVIDTAPHTLGLDLKDSARTITMLGDLTIGTGATVSNTNTGDQTITLTGDVTGSGTGSFAATLANSGVSAGSAGSTTSIPTLTVDAKGRVTALGSATPAYLSNSGTSIQAGAFGNVKQWNATSAAYIVFRNNDTGLTADRNLNFLVNDAARTINLSGNLTVTAAATINGTNTGDQTITLTGDVTGSGTGSFAATLANSGVSAATYGSATQVPVFAVDAKGRVTSVTNTTITGGASADTYATFGNASSTPSMTSGAKNWFRNTVAAGANRTITLATAGLAAGTSATFQMLASAFQWTFTDGLLTYNLTSAVDKAVTFVFDGTQWRAFGIASLT